MKTKYLVLCSIFFLLPIVCLADTSANIYDDWAHFGIGGCISGAFSLGVNNPYKKEPLWGISKRTGARVYLGEITVPNDKFDFLPGILATTIFETVDQLLHKNSQFYWDHWIMGETGGLLADTGVMILLKIHVSVL